MARFAKVINNKVINVILADQAHINSLSDIDAVGSSPNLFNVSPSTWIFAVINAVVTKIKTIIKKGFSMYFQIVTKIKINPKHKDIIDPLLPVWKTAKKIINEMSPNMIDNL